MKPKIMTTEAYKDARERTKYSVYWCVILARQSNYQAVRFMRNYKLHDGNIDGIMWEHQALMREHWMNLARKLKARNIRAKY